MSQVRFQDDVLGEKADEALLPPPITMPSAEALQLKTMLFIFMNCAATIAVVFLNKITFSDPQLKMCQMSTAAYHFGITFTVLYFASTPPAILSNHYKPLFTPQRVAITTVLPICTLFASFLVLNNLSLTYNTVGFFQLAKILTVPSVVLFDFLLFRKTVSQSKLIAVCIACVGVGIATTGAGVHSNSTGTILAVAAFCSTALYQICIGRMLASETVELTAPQLLMNQTPISVVMLLCLVPWFDQVPNFGTIPPSVAIAWLGGGLLAAMINLSQFFIIGSTSVLTFNIVGIVKTVLIIVLSWVVEGKVIGVHDTVGVALAMTGSFLYAQVKT